MALLPVRRAYDLWAPRYASTGDNPLSRLAAELVAAMVPPRAQGLLLDLGCGAGRHLPMLAERAELAIGLDLSGTMLRLASARGPVLAADLARLPLPDACASGALAALSFSHTPDALCALRELARVLRDGGWLLIVDLHPSTMARGWQRTFRGPSGERLAVAWHAHGLEDLRTQAEGLGLHVDDLRTVGFSHADLGPAAPAAAWEGEALYGLRLRRGPPRLP